MEPQWQGLNFSLSLCLALCCADQPAASGVMVESSFRPCAVIAGSSSCCCGRIKSQRKEECPYLLWAPHRQTKMVHRDSTEQFVIELVFLSLLGWYYGQLPRHFIWVCGLGNVSGSVLIDDTHCGDGINNNTSAGLEWPRPPTGQ